MINFFKKNKWGIVLTILILIIGTSAYYFVNPLNKVKNNMIEENKVLLNPSLFINMKIKVAYTKEGSIKLFVNARNNGLAKLMVFEGDSIPEKETIVIGFDEAKMMKEEKLFEKIGDRIENLFNINVTIGGIINKTDSIIDDIHFISNENYNKLDGEENRVFIKLNSDNISKVFYYQNINEDFKINFSLSEGKIINYKKYDILSKSYYPVIIGSKEAKMMKEEKLFEKPGDTIDDFFGKDIIIVGIIQETNTSLDMMHILPFKAEELN